MTEKKKRIQEALRHARARFVLDRKLVHLNCMLVSSHPKPVQKAITARREKIDKNPDGFIRKNVGELFDHAAEKAGAYLGLSREDALAHIRQTESTTVGLANLYNGIRLRQGEEFLTSKHDFFSTRLALESLDQRTQVSTRRIRLFEKASKATGDGILKALEREIRPFTRVLALTWVHSGTGLRIPVRRIAALVARVNEKRLDSDRLLFCLDGVHGFGVEDFRFEDLGCDFFVAGCHKWLFGPRGTAIVCGRPDAWRYVTQTVPSLNPNSFPGGILPYEYHWAVAEAFDFHLELGKDVVEKHTIGLAHKLKKGLKKLPKVSLVTPMARSLSSGIVCCDVGGVTAEKAVHFLKKKHKILASVSSADADGAQHLRFSPSILNTEEEIEKTIAAVGKIE